MSTEIYLVRIRDQQLQRMQQQGIDSVMADLWESKSERPDRWLLIDEHMLGFMRHEDPMHPTLYDSVMGGSAFQDSPGRDDYPRYFASSEVGPVADALNRISEADLQARFVATRHLFGGFCIGGTDEEAYERLNGKHQEISAFYRHAAQNTEVILLLLH